MDAARGVKKDVCRASINGRSRLSWLTSRGCCGKTRGASVWTGGRRVLGWGKTGAGAVGADRVAFWQTATNSSGGGFDSFLWIDSLESLNLGQSFLSSFRNDTSLHSACWRTPSSAKFRSESRSDSTQKKRLVQWKGVFVQYHRSNHCWGVTSYM